MTAKDFFAHIFTLSLFFPSFDKKKSSSNRPRFGGAAHLFELSKENTRPIVITRLWNRKTDCK